MHGAFASCTSQWRAGFVVLCADDTRRGPLPHDGPTGGRPGLLDVADSAEVPVQVAALELPGGGGGEAVAVDRDFREGEGARAGGAATARPGAAGNGAALA